MTANLLALAAAPAVAALVVWCIREPMRVAMPLFAALIPFGGALSIGPSRFGSLSSIMGAVLGVGLALQLVTRGRSAPRVSPTVPIWLLFLGAAGATTLWTIDRPATTSGFIVLGSLILVYALAAVSHVDRTILRRTENGLLVGAVAVVCYGLTQLLFLGGFPSDAPGAGSAPADDGRFGNDLLGPGLLAVTLLLPLVIALNRVVSGTERSTRVLHSAIALTVVAGILMTGSRAGTLAAGIVVVTLMAASPRRARRALLAFLVVGVAAAALVWTYNPGGVAARTFESAASSSGRTDIWRIGVTACSEYCLQGSGWGTYPDVYADTQASVPGAQVLVGAEGTYQPHNLWLLAAVELGLPGLALLIAGLGLALVEAVRLPERLRGPPLSALVGTIFAVFFFSSMEFKFFWMVFIMVALNRNLADAESTGAPTAPEREAPTASTP